LKPERLGANPWFYAASGDAYGRLRQWGKARADHDQAVKVAAPTERGYFQLRRVLHFAAQGQWKPAADDMKQVRQVPADVAKEWWALRDAALIFAMAGDAEGCRKAAADCLSKQSAGDPNPDENRWTVLTMLLLPDMITNENRARLLELASKTEPYWKPRLTAAIHFRDGEYEKAAELFQANPYGPQFSFLAAIVQQKLGHQDRAKQLFDEGNSWVREQRDKDPGAGVPQPQAWQDWASVVSLQFEASELVLGPEVGAPRKLALQGDAVQAAQAYAKALAEAADQGSQSRILEELAQFDDVLAALRPLVPDDPRIQQSHRRMIERTAEEFSRKLDAMNGTSGEDQASRSQLISSIIRRRDGVPESLLKLRPDDTLLQAGSSVLVGDWNNAATCYSKLIEANDEADSVARMVPPSLWAYGGEIGQHRVSCQKMYERYRDSAIPNDIERTLKVMLLVENGPELPPDSVRKFVASIDVVKDADRAWFLATRALLECRKGNHAEAHKWADEALALEKASPMNGSKLLTLAVQSLTYAKQKDVAQARKSLDQVKQIMSQNLKMNWTAAGSLEGGTIVNGVTIEHDKLIPEIIRREAEQLIQSAVGSSPPKPPGD